MKHFGFFRPSAKTKPLLFQVLMLIALIGCAVGPDYQRPEATAVPEAYAGAFGEWKLAEPQARLPRGNWWEIFGDPELNELESRVASANFELKIAAARFAQARATADATAAGLFPRLGVFFQATEQRDSENRPVGGKPGQTYDSYSVPFDASYEIDLWGRVRRSVDSATAQAEAIADDAESIRLAIQAEVAADYFTLRTLDAERELLLAGIDVQRRSLELIRNRRAGGMISDIEVAQAETLVKTAEAQLPDNALQRDKIQNALAALIGVNASIFRLAEKPLDLAPTSIPPGLPSELLERRPDIAAAERRMAAANAGIGLSTSAYFPSIKLNGLVGIQSGNISSLLTWPSRLWAIGPALSLPLLDGQERGATLRRATAAYEETVARYRQTVLNAFADVENSLSAENYLAEEYAKAKSVNQSARKQLDIVTNRYNAGLVTYLDVATTKNALLASERACTRLLGQRMVTTVALIKSLGGSWQRETVVK